MEYYKTSNEYDEDCYHVRDSVEIYEDMVNFYIDNNLSSKLSMNAMYVKSKILCEYFNYLKGINLNPLYITFQDLADFFIHVRCPNGIHLNSINQSQVSESELNKYLTTITDFYTSYNDYFDNYAEHLYYQNYNSSKYENESKYECIEKVQSLFKGKRPNTIRKELDELSSNILYRINKIEYLEILSDEQDTLLFNSCKSDIERLIYYLISTVGLNTSFIPIFTKNKESIKKIDSSFYLLYSRSYKKKLSRPLFLAIYKYKDNLRNLSKSNINAYIKTIGKRAGLYITETTLVKTCIVNEYVKTNSVIEVSFTTNRHFDYIFKTLKRYYRDEHEKILQMYKLFHEEFISRFKREYSFVDEEMTSYEIKSDPSAAYKYWVKKNHLDKD